MPLLYYSLIMFFYTFIAIFLLFSLIIGCFQKYIINNYKKSQQNQIIEDIQTYLTIILLSSTALYILINFYQIAFLPEEIQSKLTIPNWSKSDYLLSYSGYFTLLKLFFTLYIKKLIIFSFFLLFIFINLFIGILYINFQL